MISDWRKIIYDELTGLYRREVFLAVLPRFLRDSFRRNGKVTVVFIDLNGLKAVNDSLGHAFGDKLISDAAFSIKAVARLSSGISTGRRRADLLCRWGGDEFVAVISGDEVSATVFTERVKLNAASKNISLAFGFASVESLAGFDAALHEADRQMYEAKGALSRGGD